MTVQELVKDTVKKAFVAIKSKIADIETALADKVPKSQSPVLSNGTKIPANADLDDYTTPGVYYSPDSSVTATLSNVPLTSVGFKLIVMRCGYSGTSYLMQLCIKSTSASMASSVWARITNNSGAWQDWNVLSLTDQNSLFIHASTYADVYNACQKLPAGRSATIFTDTNAARDFSDGAIAAGLSFRGVVSHTSGTTYDFVGTSGAGQFFWHIRSTLAASGATLLTARKIPLSMSSDPIFKHKSYTYAYSNIAAGGSLNIKLEDFDISTVSGYKPLCARNFYSGNASMVAKSVIPTNTGAGTTIMALKNEGSSAVSGTAGINILYIKTDVDVVSV